VVTQEQIRADRSGSAVQDGEVDVLVVGGGAAGLMAAISAARAGAHTVLLERTGDGGRKILISGGGRCNVLPGTFRPGEYVTDSSPNSLRKILRSWPLREQRSFFEDELGIPLKHEEEGDKLFPVSDRARDVRDALVAGVMDAGGRIHFQRTVVGIARAGGGVWSVSTEEGVEYRSPRLVLATGGLSVAATGSDGRGLAWVRELGHVVHPTYPALTPLLADPPVHAHLAGVSLEVHLSARSAHRERSARGGFLFTHRGYSGPAVLGVSHVAVRSLEDGGERASVQVDWTGEGREAWEARLQSRRGTVASVLTRHLPQRLVAQLVAEAGVPEERILSQLRRDERLGLLDLLVRYPLPWSGHEGYKKAEVTGGGVALDQVDPGTLESRVTPGLYLCGEMLDAFGPIGGHNFLWAWATGRAAGRSAAKAGPARLA
jgi:predicted Rossmann fold flavoprotein